MKVRYGFISNSSSSSFIVCDRYRTTAQIMKDMLELVKAEWKEEKYNIREITKVITWLKKHPKTDTPLLFPNTCNYETWVFKDETKLDTTIETCNNHDSNWQSMNFDYRSEEDYEKTRNYMKTLVFLDLSDMKEKTYEEYESAAYPELLKFKKDCKNEN